MFVWRYLDANEEDIGNSDPFEDQEAAEAWLGGKWESLLERGIVGVLLFRMDGDPGTCVYRMSLEPEAPR